MSQSDHMFNPTDCQMFTLCLMHLTHILENAFMFHYLYANTSAFNHLFEPHATLSKILPNICTSFSTSSTFTPSYSCLVPHNPRLVYIIIQYGYYDPLLSEFFSWACPEFSERSEYERAWVPLSTLHLFHFLLFSLAEVLWAQVQGFWVPSS